MCSEFFLLLANFGLKFPDLPVRALRGGGQNGGRPGGWGGDSITAKLQPQYQKQKSDVYSKERPRRTTAEHGNTSKGCGTG